jgi:hypothetical protein
LFQCLFFQQQRDPGRAQRFLVDRDAGQRRDRLGRAADVVEADDGDIGRHLEAGVEAGLHGRQGRAVVIAEQGVGARTRGQQAQRRLAHGFQRVAVTGHVGLEFGVGQHARIEQGLAVAARALVEAVVAQRAGDHRDAPASGADQVARGEVAAKMMVRIHRSDAVHVHVDQGQRLAAVAQHGHQFRLEVAGAQDCVRLLGAQQVGHRLARIHHVEGQGRAGAPAGVFRALQHRRIEGAGRERVVLAVQQKGDAPDCAHAQAAEVVAQFARGGQDARAGRLGQAGLVLQRARHRADRAAGCAREVADGHAHWRGAPGRFSAGSRENE